MPFRVRANRGKERNISRECLRNIDIGNCVMDVARYSASGGAFWLYEKFRILSTSVTILLSLGALVA